MRIAPRSITGTLHPQNYTAVDWGWQNYVAYGCQNSVVVLDPQSVQVVQTLTHGHATINKVRWCKESHHAGLGSSPYVLRLVSMDTSGLCVLWDVSEGSIITEFNCGPKQVNDIQWIINNEMYRDLLAVLVAPSTFSIWNTQSGTKLTSIVLNETLVTMAVNPFDSSCFLFQSPEYLILMRGFSPLINEHAYQLDKFRLCHVKPDSHLPGNVIASKTQVKRLVPVQQAKEEDGVLLVGCLQVVFSPNQRNQLLLLFKKEVLILDIDMGCSIGSVHLEKSTSPFLHIVPTWQRNVLLCAHENGSISLRVRKDSPLPTTSIPASPGYRDNGDIVYHTVVYSDPLRLSRNFQVAGMAVCPSSEIHLALLVSDGRCLILKLFQDELTDLSNGDAPVVYAKRTTVPSFKLLDSNLGEALPPSSLDELIASQWESTAAEEQQLVQTSESSAHYEPVQLQFSLHGLSFGIGVNPTCMKMGPPVTTKNWSFHVPYLALGFNSGNIQIVNLLNGTIYKELAIHTCPVGGIEWVTMTTIVSFAHTQPNSTGRVKNELTVTDLDTGGSHVLLRDRQGDNSPISFIRVSPLKYYMIVVFSNKPIEIWDMESLQLIKVLSGIQIFFPIVEWTVTSQGRPLLTKKKYDSPELNVDHVVPAHHARELLTMVSKDGSTYQISIEGSKVKNLTHTPLYFGVTNITSLSWKPELMACGTSDGEIVFYDVRQSQSRIVPIGRGYIRKIRFAPGKGNLKYFILSKDCIEIRNALEDKVVSKLKWSKDQQSVENAEWANSDKPVLLMSGGIVRVWDLSLKQCQSPMVTCQYSDPFFCPSLIPSNMVVKLKSVLQHEPWTLHNTHRMKEFEELFGKENENFGQFHFISEDTISYLSHAPLGLPQRCMYVAKMFGEEFEYQFWKVSLYFLVREKLRFSQPNYKKYRDHLKRVKSSKSSLASPSVESTSSLKNMADLLLALDNLELDSSPQEVFAEDTPPAPPSDEAVQSDIGQAEKELNQLLPSLDARFDVLLNSDLYKMLELQKTILLDTRRVNYILTQKCINQFLFLKQTERAVQLLLETDSSNPCYYSDSLKACLVTMAQPVTGMSQSTVKLIATNLIANSRLTDGAQLLCMIGKGMDACRYLQTYGQWIFAAWLSKVGLSEQEHAEVMVRWIDHLLTVNQTQQAILLLAGLGKFDKVVEALHLGKYSHIAATFTEVCQQFGFSFVKKDISNIV